MQSELSAQLEWSEMAVREREALQAELAQLRSDLAAQLRWAEQAVADWSQRIAGHEAALAAIQGSLAWRLSRPLRAIEARAKPFFKTITGRRQ